MTPDLTSLVGLANAAFEADGWILIPYGDSRHSGKDGLKNANAETIKSEKPVIQRFTREDAQAIVDDFKSTWTRIKRAFVGLPLYKGHPDAPRFATRFPDKTPRGAIADMEATDRGLRIKPVLTEQGAKDVDSGWNEFSPYWACYPVGMQNGERVVAPRKIWSGGLVPRGNIPGLSLINAADDPAPTNMNLKEVLVKLLTSLGKTVASDASDDTISGLADECCSSVATANAAEETAKTKAAEVAEQLKDREAQVATLEGEKLALVNAAEVEKSRAATIEAAFKAERLARSRVIIASAFSAGKIAASAIEQEVSALANASDFDAALSALEARKPTLKTASSIGAIADHGKEQKDRQSTVLGLVNSYMEENKVSYDDAFAAVSRAPANAALFGAMKKPEVVKK